MKFIPFWKVKKSIDIITDSDFIFGIRNDEWGMEGIGFVNSQGEFTLRVKEFGDADTLKRNQILLYFQRDTKGGELWSMVVKQGLGWGENPNAVISGWRWEKFREAVRDLTGLRLENIGIVSLYKEAEKEIKRLHLTLPFLPEE